MKKYLKMLPLMLWPYGYIIWAAVFFGLGNIIRGTGFIIFALLVDVVTIFFSGINAIGCMVNLILKEFSRLLSYISRGYIKYNNY